MIRTFLFGLAIIFSGLPSSLLAQDVIFQIDMITHMNSAREVIVEDDAIYAATSGGLLIVDRNNNRIDRFTAVDGMYNHFLTALDRDRNDRWVLGSVTGNLAFLDPADGSVVNDENLAGNEIVDLQAVGDTLWVLTKTFASVYLYNTDLARYQFREVYGEFGVSPGVLTGMALAKGRIWISTDIGLLQASSDFLTVNLFAGSNWSLITTADGLSDNTVNDIVYSPQSGRLFLATGRGLSIYDFFTFQNVGTPDLRSIGLANNGVVTAGTRSVYTYRAGLFNLYWTVPHGEIQLVTESPEGNVWVAIEKRGLRNIDTGEIIYVDGPLDNYIGEMRIDSRQRLWCSSGIHKNERRQGIFVQEDGRWTNYHLFGGNSDSYQFMNSSNSVYEDVDQNVWVGAWGGGVLVFDNSGDIHSVNTLETPGSIWRRSASLNDTIAIQTDPAFLAVLSPVSENPLYTVVSDIIPDPARQAIWILNAAAGGNREAVFYDNPAFGEAAFDPATWQAFQIPVQNKEWYELTLDIFGDLWSVSALPQGGTPVAQCRVGEFGLSLVAQYSETNNLKTNTTFSVAADDDGYVWIGTGSGLNAILNGTVFDLRENFQPIGLKINDIYVDSRNNKWFATDKGVSVLLASGSPFDPQSWIDIVPFNSTVDPDQANQRANFFETNLPAENIHSIVLNDATGDVFLATGVGIAIIRNNPFASTFRTFDQVTVGPNPFILSEDAGNPLNLYNLIAGSEVRILTANGQLVRTLQPANFEEVRGGLAQWDGRNMEGKLVTTGVYVYLIVNDEGQSTSGKFLVIRQ